MKRSFIFLFSIVLSLALEAQFTVNDRKTAAAFTVVSSSLATPIYVDAEDHAVVLKVAALLQADIEKVSGQKPVLHHDLLQSPTLIIIGSIDKSPMINQLIKQKKINAGQLLGKWEAFSMQVVQQPIAGVKQALVIMGSDRRGTAYGVLELSKQIGVSPWYWWADVPVKKKKEIYLQVSSSNHDAPKVKYRGIFINDEAPALSGWSREKFGGFNHAFYEKVFELILRLKGNYLWPAMWGSAFYDDDSLNIKAANDWAVVIGTSHHEPLMRAHDEWRRYGKGKWDYDSNEVRLKTFWRDGMKRAQNEKIVSIGMRGDGDAPMSRQTATALLERIVKDQRGIIADVSGKPASATPQLWALYKEVQDYYDKGMRVPDDVTLLLCDDNWGNIRKLPKLTDPPRKGGYGIYYHFDYVGGPRNYKWINTNPIPRVWEQMHLAYEYGVKDIWIVNVGDIKPMEFPISFFLDYAWNPDKINAEDLQRYTTRWAEAQFGQQHAAEIAAIISAYAKYNGRRKPELLNANTYQFNYDEHQRVTKEYTDLLKSAETIYADLPAVYRDAYFQLVMHPVAASANLQQLYYAVAMNHRLATANIGVANQWAELAKSYYLKDSLLTVQYHGIGNGKWNHMMSQTHIGYTYWQQPEKQRMPEVKYVSAEQGILVDTALNPEKQMAAVPKGSKTPLFYELNGSVSIAADHFSRKVNTAAISWKLLPDHGRTGNALTAFPVTAKEQVPGENGPYVAYDCYLYSTGTAKLVAYFSPTLNFHNSAEGLQYAVSIDEETPQRFSLNKDDNNNRTWEKWVADNIIRKTSSHTIAKKGKHVIKFWMISPGVVLQKLVLDMGGLKESYLGPPETVSK